MTRFQRLTVAVTAVTYVLIGAGGLVRATDSGLGCPDWPRCFGRWMPPASTHAWIEHTHRLLAALLVVLVGALVVAAWRTRQPGAVRRASVGALVLVTSQALLGAVVVWGRLQADSVTLHLATALGVLALGEYIAFRAGHPTPPQRAAEPARPRRFVRLAVAAAALTYVQMLVGSTVTGHDAGLAFPDFPLAGGRIVPELRLAAERIQFAHRVLALVVGAGILYLWWRARRDQREHASVTRLAGYAAGFVGVQIALGAANVWDRLSALSVVPHLAVGSLTFGTLVALVLHAGRYAGAPRSSEEPSPAPRRPLRATAGAYLALTKPRIIELLLVTTVPTMFLAARGVPPPWLVAATLIGGSLSAASANTINCYLDRDIDQVMRRTRRRPLPAHRVEPLDALRFGIVLGIAGFVWLWLTVNLLSACLATGAVLFYVFVYTLGLKRRSSQNIVIGGAAGAVPVLVGWTAVTGTVGIPALVLFAIIFYWTPPHFWALSMRFARDYEAAGVPMLPVVRGQRETAHQILYYTVLLVAVTLLMVPAGRMGAIYLVAALGLGGAFIWRAVQLWRDASSSRAIRLFSFSNRYLALLFAAVALDALVRINA